MKTLVSCVLAALLAGVVPAHAADPKTEDEKVLYALGMAISQNLSWFNLSEGELKMVEQGLEDGTLTDGSVFDSSVQRGEPVTFPLDKVIRCWTEGVQQMKVGGKSRLVCPADLAYGDRGAPPRIKPGATLVFEVELLGIEK